MSTFYRAPEIRFLQAQGRLNSVLDPFSDSESESDDESFTAVPRTPSASDSILEEKEEMDGKGKMEGGKEEVFVRPYRKEDREAVAAICLATASPALKSALSPPPTSPGEVEPEPLAPHLWAYPYVDLSPDYCFVLEAKSSPSPSTSTSTSSGTPGEAPGEASGGAPGGTVVGYILGTPSTIQFTQRIATSYITPQLPFRPWLHASYLDNASLPTLLKISGPPGETAVEEAERTCLAMLMFPETCSMVHRHPKMVGEGEGGYPAHLHINILPEWAGKGWGRRLMEGLWGRLRGEGVRGVHLECGADNENAIQFYEHLGFERWEGEERKEKEGEKEEKGGNEDVNAEVGGCVMVKKL